MSTLLLSTWNLPASKDLAQVARDRGWELVVAEQDSPLSPIPNPVFYGTTDSAHPLAEEHGLLLLEPPLDLLAQLPAEFLRRPVVYGSFSDLSKLRRECFIKPADALHKAFDAGIYRTPQAIRHHEQIAPDTPVLIAEPVIWQAEFRCFIRHRTIVAWSPYLRFGRPTWKAFSQLPSFERGSGVPEQVSNFCQRFFDRCSVELPPSFVMDVGVIEDRGWGVVEFNPAWCSGLLGADPRGVLHALEQATQTADSIEAPDRRWILRRSDCSELSGSRSLCRSDSNQKRGVLHLKSK